MNEKKYLIKDPVYGAMSVSYEVGCHIRPIMDHRLFQRLRHIKQLSFVDFIFPGAVHTRFNHSLGCAYNCNRIFKQLFPGGGDLGTEILLTTAGLLHDVGHGPFSHAFENLKILKDKEIKHESWFMWFAKEIFSDPKIIDASLMNDVLDIFDTKKNCDVPWIKNVISSQIDADRMDYILRDSHFCGVKYGIYDIEWLISCLGLYNNKELVVTEKGVGSAEQFLHARSLLHQNVYFNVKSSAISKCAIDFLEHLVIEIEEINKIIPNIRLCYFINKLKDNYHQNKEQLIESLYPTYKYLVDFDIWYAVREIAMSTGTSTCQKLARRLHNRDLPYALPINSNGIGFVKDIVQEKINKYKLESWEIAVVDQNVKFYEESKDPVYIINSKGAKLELNDISTLICKTNNQINSIPFLYIDKSHTKIAKEIVEQCNKHAVFVMDKIWPNI